MSDKIRLRSPYYVQITDEDSTYTLANATIEIKVITGESSSLSSASVLYTLTKDATGSFVIFEISELVRDYITTEFTGTYTSQPVWVNVSATGKDASNNAVTIALNGGTAGTSVSFTGLGFDAYSEYKDGANKLILDDRGTASQTPPSNFTALTNVDKIRKPVGEVFTVAVNSEAVDNGDAGFAAFYSSGTRVSPLVTIDSTTNTDSKITYVSCDADVTDEFRIYDNTDTSSPIKTIPVEEIKCSKLGFAKATFYNQYGALQDLFFFGKQIETLNTTEEQFKANAFNTSTVSYTTTSHQYKVFDKQAKESISLSTGYMGIEYNSAIKELMLSESVWITINSVVFPAIVKSSSQVFKTVAQDSLISYTVEFDYAFDQIQNIR